MANIRNGVFTLLSNATATGQQAQLPGGRYIWTVNASNWNGATASLQSVGADGTTLMTATSLTADGNAEVIVGQDAKVQVTITGGPPTAVFSTLRGVQ